MDISGLLGVIGGLLALVALGVALRVSGLLTAEDSRPLNTVLMYVALPALIFSSVYRAELDPKLGMLPAIAWVVALLGLAIGWILARLLKLEGPTAGAFIMACVFGNTGYMGYPVASALMGDAGLVRAIFSDVFGNTAAVISVGSFVAGYYGAGDVKVNPLKEIVTFPPFIALAAALALHSVPIPSLVTSWLDGLGMVVIPVIMISVGLSLKPRELKGHLSLASVVVVVKLLVLPLIAFGLGALLLDDPDSQRVAIIEAGVPSMMLLVIMGQRYKLDSDFIASAILATMIGAVVTIPLLQLLLG
ncbi:MAG: AEC family transporter [Coriobacteriia bacterium]